MNTVIKWTGAIVLSLLVHAGAATLFEPGEEPADLATTEGGQAVEVAVLGNAFEETILAGNPEEAVEPEKVEPEEVEPQPVDMADVLPLQTEIKAETPTDIVPTDADVIVPTEDLSTVLADQPEIVATVAPVETVVPEEKPEPEEIAKREPEKKPEAKKKPEKDKPQKKPVRKKTGDEGKQAESLTKGQADGVEKAAASANSGRKGKVAQAFGDAAESNYKGKVRSKVQRHFRYPRSADRAGVRGTVTVGFTITAGGGAVGIKIVSGSGSPVLDAAALDAVRKAEPFPSIPEAANRSSWFFTLPLQFGR